MTRTVNAFLTLLLICIFECGLVAQNSPEIRTDTVKQGFYIPLDSNVVSCKVGILPQGGKLEMINMQGNSLSSETISQIGVLKNGSVVVYSEITVLSKGTFVKSKSVRYVIGARNSVPALRDPSLPDTLSAAEIGAIVLDKEVFSFQIVFVLEGAVYDFEMTGNGVAPTVKDKLLTLPAGTKVWFESIKSEDGTGAKRILPSRVFVIK